MWIYNVEGLDLDEDTKSYWYPFCFRLIKSPLGVHDLPPNTSHGNAR